MAKTITDFEDSLKSDGTLMILESFPQKVLQLDSLLDNARFRLENLKNIKVESNIPMPVPVANSGDTLPVTNGKPSKDWYEENSKCLAGPIPCNKHISELIDEVVPLIHQLIQDCETLHLWVMLHVPKIEDGNNFGVSIQEEVLRSIRTIIDRSSRYTGEVTRYAHSRGKTVSKIIKYPHVTDYRQDVIRLDEQQFYSLRLTVTRIRNHYAGIYSLIKKNIEKILTPRTKNHNSFVN